MLRRSDLMPESDFKALPRSATKWLVGWYLLSLPFCITWLVSIPLTPGLFIWAMFGGHVWKWFFLSLIAGWFAKGLGKAFDDQSERVAIVAWLAVRGIPKNSARTLWWRCYSEGGSAAARQLCHIDNPATEGMLAEEFEKVLHNYGDFMQHGESNSPDAIYDEKRLPYSRRNILMALAFAMEHETDEAISNLLFVSATGLAKFQPGVGEPPLGFSEDVIGPYNVQLSTEELTEYAKLVVSKQDDPRHESYKRTVATDLTAIAGMMELARSKRPPVTVLDTALRTDCRFRREEAAQS